MTDKDFFEDWFQTDEGAFKAVNLCDAVSGATLERSVFSEFAHELEGESARTTSVSNPIELFDAVASRKDVGGGSKFSTKGLAVASLESDYLATTINAKYLRDGFVASDKSKYRSLLGLVSKFYGASSMVDRNSIEDDILRHVERRTTDDDGLLPVELDSGIKGPSRESIVWFTSYGESGLPECGCWRDRANWRERADCARDILGLDHFGSNNDLHHPAYAPTLLATLIIPKSSIPNMHEFYRPTPLDGVGRRFKSVFGDLRKRPDKWGRTAHLERILGKRPHRGGRELVAQNFRPTGPIFFSILGYTRVPRRDWVPIKDAEFLRSLSRKRSKPKFVERLERLAQP